MISNVGQGFSLALSNPKGLPYKINNAFALVIGYWLVVICFLLFAMKIFGIDTSTSCGSVGLIDDEEIIADTLLNIPVTHSERLLGTIELMLNKAHCAIEDLDGWAISLGPGSFTGLRK